MRAEKGSAPHSATSTSSRLTPEVVELLDLARRERTIIDADIVNGTAKFLSGCVCIAYLKTYILTSVGHAGCYF